MNIYSLHKKLKINIALRLTDVIERLGFSHRDRWYLNGEESRLIILDPSINKNDRLGYSSALFNTRSGNIIIGLNVMFGHDCQILTGRHLDNFRDPLKYKPTVGSGFDITISNGVWLTSRVIVTGGVCIGENATILPGSVVTKDIPANCIAGGMPARFIRYKTLQD